MSDLEFRQRLICAALTGYAAREDLRVHPDLESIEIAKLAVQAADEVLRLLPAEKAVPVSMTPDEILRQEG